jgi:hypothetical protein
MGQAKQRGTKAERISLANRKIDRDEVNNWLDFLKKYSKDAEDLMNWIGMIVSTKGTDCAYITLDKTKLVGLICSYDDLVAQYKKAGRYEGTTKAAMESFYGKPIAAISNQWRTIFFNINVDDIFEELEAAGIVKKKISS